MTPPARRPPPHPPRDSVDVIVTGWRDVRSDLDVTPVAVIARLGRIRAAVEHELEAVFAEHGLTAATFAALAAIARLSGADGVSQVRLMRSLHLTSGTISVRIDRLVADGLAERHPDPDDGRGTRVTLTPRGRDAFERAAPAHLRNERRLLASLTPAEQSTLADLLRRLLLDFEGCADPADDPGRRLGATLAPASAAIAMRRAVGLSERAGLLVRSVDPAGPAASAGVEPGDLIVAAEGRDVRSLVDLHDRLPARRGSVTLEMLRGDRRVRAVAQIPTPPARD